jgi:hypothetical protein
MGTLTTYELAKATGFEPSEIIHFRKLGMPYITVKNVIKYDLKAANEWILKNNKFRKEKVVYKWKC